MKVNPSSHSLRILVLSCLVFFSLFLLVTFLRTSFRSVDVAVDLWSPTIRSSAITFFAVVVALIFDTTSLVVISIVIAGILMVKGYKEQGLLLLGAMAGDALLVTIIKNLDQVARPMNGIMPNSSYSYPSGHCAGIVVFAGFFAYFAWQHWQSTRSRIIIGVGFGVIAGIVGFDRVYLSVHWLSDVLGGWLFGAFWLTFVLLIFLQLSSKGLFESERFGRFANFLFLAAVAVAAVLVIWTFI